MVPEALKNILLVMAAQGVLTPTWQVRRSKHCADCARSLCDNLWNLCILFRGGRELAHSDLEHVEPDSCVAPNAWISWRVCPERAIQLPEAVEKLLTMLQADPRTIPAKADPCTSILQDAQGHSLWELTWHRAQAVSSGLTPALLASSGLVTVPVPPEQPTASEQTPLLATPVTADGAAGMPADHPESSPQIEADRGPAAECSSAAAAAAAAAEPPEAAAASSSGIACHLSHSQSLQEPGPLAVQVCVALLGADSTGGSKGQNKLRLSACSPCVFLQHLTHFGLCFAAGQHPEAQAGAHEAMHTSDEGGTRSQDLPAASNDGVDQMAEVPEVSGSLREESDAQAGPSLAGTPETAALGMGGGQPEGQVPGLEAAAPGADAAQHRLG